MSIESYRCPSQNRALQEYVDHHVSPQASRYVESKATLDCLAAFAMLALSWPLILALMALVRLTSRGPALYKQVRLGLDGRPYSILKLRTMYHDCERATGPQWAKARDPRATLLGRVLRATHLDELPQLWNVVRGEMSLVGPRPERPEFVRELEHVIPNYRERLRVRPGITGLAQVQLPPDEDVDGVARKVAYDVYYVERINLWLDLRILVGTALKIAGNSYSCIRLLVALPQPEVVLGRAPEPEQELNSDMALREFVTTAG
jgi:lipopolysaccharide/colanic/teichoic acid biosynthesis glycosyltransferase